jgi:hypothetical protein
VLFPTFYDPTLKITGSCSIPNMCTATHYLNQHIGTFQCLKALRKTPNLAWAANQLLTTELAFFMENLFYSYMNRGPKLQVN